MAIQKKSLIERWNQQQQWQELYPKIIASLQTNADLGELVIPQHEGRWDLRGISLRVTGTHVPGEIELPGGVVFRFVLGSRPRFTNVQLRKIDFSYADLNQAIFEHCLLEDVLFHYANGGGVDDTGSTFRNVDLFRAKWRGATLGLEGARYEKVSFRRTDLRDALCYRGYFIDCDFSDAVIQNVDFRVSHFIRCKFRGKLKRVWFRSYYPYEHNEEEFGKTERNPMEDIDFSNAEFLDVMFTENIDLSRVIPPQDGQHVLFRNWPNTVLIAKQEVTHQWKGVSRTKAIGLLDAVFGSKHQTMDIVNMVFLEQSLGKSLARSFPNSSQAQQFAKVFTDLLRRSGAQAEQKSD